MRSDFVFLICARTTILDGVFGKFHDDVVGNIVDSRDREGFVDNQSAFVSRFIFSFPFYSEVDLITGIYFLIVLAMTFVKVAPLAFLCSLELVSCVDHCFHNPLFPLWLNNILR